MAGALISLEEDNLSDTAVAHFFCPQASQATAVELAIRGATGQDLMVSLQVDFAHSQFICLQCPVQPVTWLTAGFCGCVVFQPNRQVLML